jgi:hypothetical protein
VLTFLAPPRPSAVEAFDRTCSFIATLQGDPSVTGRLVRKTLHARSCKRARRAAGARVPLSEISPSTTHLECAHALEVLGTTFFWFEQAALEAEVLERALALPLRTLDDAKTVWSAWRSVAPHGPDAMESWWPQMGRRVQAALTSVEDRLAASPAALESLLAERGAREHLLSSSYGQSSWVVLVPAPEWQSAVLAAAATSDAALLRRLRVDRTPVLVHFAPRPPDEHPHRTQALREAALARRYQVAPEYWSGPAALLTSLPCTRRGILEVAVLSDEDTASVLDTAVALHDPDSESFSTLDLALEAARAL